MRNHAKAVRIWATGVSVGYTVILYAAGVDIGEDLRRMVAYLPSLAVVIAVVFDLWLWKWPKVRGWCSRPLISGTWITTIVPHPDSHIPEGGNRGPITAATLIEQTFWTLSVVQVTHESESLSKVAALVAPNGDSKERKTLYYSYDNQPQMKQRPRSYGHLGGSQLAVIGDHPETMSGTYWTDCLTMGSLELSFRTRKTNFATLDAALNAPPMVPFKTRSAAAVKRLFSRSSTGRD